MGEPKHNPPVHWCSGDHPSGWDAKCICQVDYPYKTIATLRAWQREAVPLLENGIEYYEDNDDPCDCATGNRCCFICRARALTAQADDNPSSIDPPGVMDEGVGDG